VKNGVTEVVSSAGGYLLSRPRQCSSVCGPRSGLVLKPDLTCHRASQGSLSVLKTPGTVKLERTLESQGFGEAEEPDSYLRSTS